MVYKSTRLLQVPLWTTQPWFTLLLKLLVDHPLLLPQSDNLMLQPHSKAVHPLSKSLQFNQWFAKYQGIPPVTSYFKERCQHHLAVLVNWYSEIKSALYHKVA